MTFPRQLKAGLQPVARRTQEWTEALERISPSCHCGTAFAADDQICVAAPSGCRRITTTAIRVGMNLLRLPNTHLDDTALADAVADLRAVFADLDKATDPQAFTRRMAEALRAPQLQEATK